MSKTLKIIIISTTVVLILGLIGFLFFYKNKTGDSGISILKNSLPFGTINTSPATSTPAETASSSAEYTGGWIGDNTQSQAQSQLFQLHKGAVAGFYSFKTNNGNNKTIARYISRGIGNIFETNMGNLKENRISNITRLKIYNAIWGNSGKNVVIRYLDDKKGETIRSFVITLTGTTTNAVLGEEAPSQKQTTQGLFLPENIKNLAISEQDDKNIFYLFNLDNSSVGTVYNLESGKSTQIFHSPITEWLPQWPNKDTITLTTKASNDTPGFLYFLNTKTKKLTKILGNINGLTTLTNPSGNKVLYSKSNNGWISLNIYDVKNNISKKLPISTLPEKCVWSKTDTDIIYCAVPKNPQLSNYPDSWYKGEISFSDDVWKINIKTYTTQRILSPTDTAREEFDIIKPQISNDGNFLFFVNKKDMSLWVIKLKEQKKQNTSD